MQERLYWYSSSSLLSLLQSPSIHPTSPLFSSSTDCFSALILIQYLPSWLFDVQSHTFFNCMISDIHWIPIVFRINSPFWIHRFDSLWGSHPYSSSSLWLELSLSLISVSLIFFLSLLRYNELTEFWIASFGTKQILTVDAFCGAFEAHLKDCTYE